MPYKAPQAQYKTLRIGKITLDDLPATNTRWVKSRKLLVIQAIQQKLITQDQAIEKYNLSQEELFSWIRSFKSHGADSLRVTHTNEYRDADFHNQGFIMIDPKDLH